MFGALKWLLGLGLVATVGIGAGVYFAFFGAGPQISYATPDLVPIDLNTTVPDAVPVNLLIAKQRNGPTGDVNLTFLKSYTRFESAAKVSDDDVPIDK